MVEEKLKEVVDFLNNSSDNGWDKEEIIQDMAGQILPKMPNTNVSYSVDEIGLVWGESRNRDDLPISFQDFVEKFYDKIIEGVCNVIETA